MDEYSAHLDEKPVSQVLAELLDLSGYEEMLRTEGSQETSG
jgi:DNA helicase-2/ATP-dependent DNA helicase PcrA